MKFIKAHQKLEVWIKAMDLVVEIYAVMAFFPRNEQYGLTSQLRRASVSVASNIAEGAARNSNKEYIRFLYFSLASCSEIDTQILICQRLQLIPEENATQLLSQIDTVYRILNGLIKYRKSRERGEWKTGSGAENRGFVCLGKSGTVS